MVVAEPSAFETLGFEKAGHRTEPFAFYAEHLEGTGFRDCRMEEQDIPASATLILDRAPGGTEPAGSDETSSSARAPPAALPN